MLRILAVRRSKWSFRATSDVEKRSSEAIISEQKLLIFFKAKDPILLVTERSRRNLPVERSELRVKYEYFEFGDIIHC